MEPIDHSSSFKTAENDDRELDLKGNRAAAAQSVALELHVANDVATEDFPVLTFVAFGISAPIVFLLYARGLLQVGGILGIAAIAWSIFYILGLWSKRRLKQHRKDAANALDELATQVIDDVD